MSKHLKASKHLGQAEARFHNRTPKYAKYNQHKLGMVVTHNKYLRDHGGGPAQQYAK